MQQKQAKSSSSAATVVPTAVAVAAAFHSQTDSETSSRQTERRVCQVQTQLVLMSVAFHALDATDAGSADADAAVG